MRVVTDAILIAAVVFPLPYSDRAIREMTTRRPTGADTAARVAAATGNREAAVDSPASHGYD